MSKSNLYLLSKNYVNADDTFSTSHTADDGYLYDQNKDTKWTSSECDDDDLFAAIEIIFYDNDTAVEREFDTIVLQNINFKTFVIKQWDGSQYATITGCSFTDSVATSIRIKLSASVTTSKIKIWIYSTIVANQEKSIGELWILKETINLETRTIRNRQDILEGGNFRGASGILNQWNIYSKWAAVFELQYITNTELATLKGIFDDHDSFTIYIDYVRDIDDILLVQWLGPWRSAEEPKTAWHTITMELQES